MLKFYDVSQPVTLSVDASSEGLGAVILQEGQPVAYGSRALTDCEKNYAQIEKELLAIVHGCEKFHQYLYGRCIQVESDHKPLEIIFKKPLHKAPSRLQKMMMRLQKYSLMVRYVPGKELHIADALSRAYLQEHCTQDNREEDEMEVSFILHQLPVSEKKKEQFQSATLQDEELRLVREAVQSGWPNSRSQVPKPIQQYWTFREELSFTDGLLFKNGKLVVPSKMRDEMLERIHEAHMGIVKCKERARDVLFWPGMAKQIEDVVSKCDICNMHRNSNPREPLVSHPVPERAWSKLGMDLFHFRDADYLLVVDYFSKYPEIAKLSDMTSKSVIAVLKSLFARHGVPDELFSDNGRQFVSAEMRAFAASWEFSHTTSSPGFPQSNGQAERAVQTIKSLLKKAQDSNRDPYIALLEFRNTPLSGIDLSPAQLLMGRRLKSKIPVSKKLLMPKVFRQVRNRLSHRQVKQKQYFDRGTRKLPELKKGEGVRIRQDNKWQPAVVLDKLQQPRSYIVQTPESRIFRRNRRYLLKTKETVCPSSHQTSSHQTEVEDDLPLPSPDFELNSEQENDVNNNASASCSSTVNAKSSPVRNSPFRGVGNERLSRFGRPIRVPSRYRE